MIKNENYVLIQGFMLNDLQLKGNELIVYAIIHGFSQNVQEFSGSLKYLAEWTNTSKQTVINCLQSLLEKGYISRREQLVNGVKFVHYKTTYLSCEEIEEHKPVQYVGNAPTLEEVKLYCEQKGYTFDVKEFYEYYDEVNWTASDSRHSFNWKKKCELWQKNKREHKSKQKVVAVPDFMREDYSKKETKKADDDLLRKIKELQEEIKNA